MRSYMVALGLLFIAFGHLSSAQTKTAAAAGEESVVRVAAGAPLTVECPLRVEQRAEWRLDGGALPPDLRAAGEAPAPRGARLAASLHAAAARAHHAGLYTCSRAPAAHRVRVLVLPAPSAHGETAAAASSAPAAPEAAAAAPEDAGGSQLALWFDVGRNFSLNCKPVIATDDKDELAFSWQKNGTDVESIESLKGRYKLSPAGDVFELTSRAHEDDFGNYTCLINKEVAREWRVSARPLARMPDNHNVVEGQKLKITCKLIGKPYPPVDWTYALDEETNGTSVLEALGGRAVLAESAAKVPNGELVVEQAKREDAGVYTCTPRAEGAQPASTVLRVKDMYAALWPFLGICLEVFVLCAIILVYEKRRTKPELEDSDTDNHDQKKT